MVTVIYPLVVDLVVSEFAVAFDVVCGFLLLLFVVKKSGSCVVCELAQEVLGFVGGPRVFVVGV